jgi:hypothetical protein
MRKGEPMITGDIQSTQPAYDLDGTYPGTCVRLQPLRWWPASLVFVFFGWPSFGMLGAMVRQILDPAITPAVRALVAVPLLAYVIWHTLFLLVAAYFWAGRLEFRVNVGQRKVEIYRGIGPFAWTWVWRYDEVLGLERLGQSTMQIEGVDPAKLKSLPLGGFTLKTKGKGMLWGFSLKGDDAERLLALLKHRHPMFHPLEKDPLHS